MRARQFPQRGHARIETPVASIRLYLETLERRQLTSPAARILRHYAARHGTSAGHDRTSIAGGRGATRQAPGEWREVDFGVIVKDAVASAVVRNHLPDGVLRFATPRRKNCWFAEIRSSFAPRSPISSITHQVSGDKPDIVVRLRSRTSIHLTERARSRIGIPHNELSVSSSALSRAPHQRGARVPSKLRETGLGLSLCAQWHASMEGCFAESEGPGTGSTFRCGCPGSSRVSQI